MTEHRPNHDVRRALAALLAAIAALIAVLGVGITRGEHDAVVAPEAPARASHELPALAEHGESSQRATPAIGPSDAPDQPGAVDTGSLPFDLGAIVEQVHFAYRESDEPGRYTGGHSTYDVEIDPTVATLRAYHASGEGEDTRESAPLRLSVSQLGRGERAVRSGEMRVEDDGHLAIARGEAVEHYRNRDEGVEQSWSFEQKPSGEGDLVVRVAARGLEYRGTTESGLHFADASGLGFRYGHGTWIDATGRETHVPARWARGAIELAVPAGVIESSAYPAVLDPIISPELALDEPVMGPAIGEQAEPSVASDGSGYLVVWHDRRSGSRYDVYGALVASDGTLQSPGGIPVSISRGGQIIPSVASDGSGYLVVWEDGRGSTSDIYGTLVTSDGAVVTPTGLLLSPDAGSQRRPSVASSGSGYLVVWEEYLSSGSDIHGTLVTSAGTVTTPSGIPVSTAVNAQQAVSVASSGSGYLVVWEDTRSGPRDVYGTLVTSSGTVQSPSGLAISTAVNEQRAPSVASSGSGYLVVWEDTRDVVAHIYGTLVTSGGTVQSPSGLAVATSDLSHHAPSVASNGSGYLVVWEDTRNVGSGIYGTVVTSAGTVQSPSGLAISSLVLAERTPSVASNGSGYLVVWEDLRSLSEVHVYGTLVASDGTVASSSGLVVSTSGARQRAPSVASSGSSYLVVWQDSRGSTPDIYGTLVTSGGTVQSPSGTPVSITANDQVAPSVASNGIGYLVVWTDLRGGSTYAVYGALLASDGTVRSPSGIVVSTTANGRTAPSVASRGTGYLVVWDEVRGDSGSDIYGTVVTSSGSVLSPSGAPVSTAANDQTAPRVASSGSGYLVVWQDARGATLDVWGALVAGDGTVQSPSGVAISTALRDQLAPSVASNGSEYLVVWQDLRNASADIYGALVASDGTVLRSVPVSTSGSNQLAPSVASDGDGYLVVWAAGTGPEDDIYGVPVASDGTASRFGDFAISTAGSAQRAPHVASRDNGYLVTWRDARSDPVNRSVFQVYGTRVTNRTVESPSGVPFVADPVATTSLAAGPDGAFVLAYHRFVPDAPFGANRAHARLIQYGAGLGNACGTDADCESGFCTDGVCCASRCEGGALDCQACSRAAGAAADGTCGPTSGNACSDGLGCTASDACAAGSCVGGASPCLGGTSCSESGAGAFECSACPAGTFSADGTGACTPCEAGTWSSDGATSCAAWTACAAGEHVTSEGSASSDRTCAPCASGTYSSITNALECAAWSTCGAGTYVSAAGTPTSDRTCSECAAGTYTDAANASSCAAWTACSASEYESAAPTAASDRACSALTVCSAGQYESMPATTTRDRACTACTVCGAGTYEVRACTATADAVCEPIGDGGVLDGGVDDGGMDDGGMDDGGVARDASLVPDAAVEPTPAAGCSCAAAGAGPRSSGPLAWAGLLALGVVVAARRRARR